jgi:hypothetical protein
MEVRTVKQLLSGKEAIARRAWEAVIAVAVYAPSENANQGRAPQLASARREVTFANRETDAGTR